MEGLKDIKEIVEVHEYSLEAFIALLVLVLGVLFVLLYLFFNRRKKRKKPTTKAIALEKLQNLDYNNTKEVVYQFSQYGELFLNEKNETNFRKIEKTLTPYKYKKEISPLDPTIEEEIKTFIKGLK